MEGPQTTRQRGTWARWLLIVPFIALLVPNVYAHAEPRLSGIPFFVWYQFLWVILGVCITGLVYALNRDEGEP
jgi:hypothetical protein